MNAKPTPHNPSNRRGKWLGSALGIALVLTLALALGLAARGWLPEQPAEASLPIDAAFPQPADQLDSQMHSATTLVANGIEVRISNVRFLDGKLLVDVCFDLPDSADWTLYEPAVTQGGRSIRWSETTPISLSRISNDGYIQIVSFASDGSSTVDYQQTGPGAKGLRCDTVVFDGVSSRGKGPSLSIPAIVAEPREGEACSPTNLAQFQNAVSKRFEGVTVACASSDGSTHVEVREIPSSISTSDVSTFIGSADFFLDLHGIRGPWIFDLTTQ